MGTGAGHDQRSGRVAPIKDSASARLPFAIWIRELIQRWQDRRLIRKIRHGKY